MLILAVNGLAVNGALPLDIVSKKVSFALYIASNSVLYTPYSVQKCLIDSLSVLFQVVYISERCYLYSKYYSWNWGKPSYANTVSGA